MRILVTGASGFAGSHLIDWLRLYGHDVRGFRGDIRDYDACQLQIAGMDEVYHLAAYSQIDECRKNPETTMDTNVRGSDNVFHAARKAKAKVLYTSTCHVYGRQSVFPITEVNAPNPNDVYSRSKLEAEKVAKEYDNVVITRAFNHFGVRQRPEWLLSKMIRKAVRGEVFDLGNNSEETRDFSYVTDIVRGYVLAMEKGTPGEVYQFCSGVERSIRSISELLAILVPTAKYESQGFFRSDDLNRSVGSWAKAWRDLGWCPSITFEEGLRRTIEWTRSVQ